MPDLLELFTLLKPFCTTPCKERTISLGVMLKFRELMRRATGISIRILCLHFLTESWRQYLKDLLISSKMSYDDERWKLREPNKMVRIRLPFYNMQFSINLPLGVVARIPGASWGCGVSVHSPVNEFGLCFRGLHRSFLLWILFQPLLRSLGGWMHQSYVSEDPMGSGRLQICDCLSLIFS